MSQKKKKGSLASEFTELLLSDDNGKGMSAPERLERNIDKTTLVDSQSEDTLTAVPSEAIEAESKVVTEVKFEKKAEPTSHPVVLSASASLVQAENLKVAQERIQELEKLVFDLRQEQEHLTVSRETLKKRVDELSSLVESHEKRFRARVEKIDDERAILEATISSKESRVEELTLRTEELEKRLSDDVKSIRVRERELENRLELLKQEKGTLVKNKDEIILDLKRQVDELQAGAKAFSDKESKLKKKMETEDDRVRKSVRALRLALSLLEGDIDEMPKLKKAK